MIQILAINAPPGSGNVFCQHLFKKNLNAQIKWLNHESLGFDNRENAHNIFLLRNPYDVIASGIEIRFLDTVNEEQSRFFDDVDFRIQDKIIRHLSEYNRFMNLAKRYDNEITTISFEFLTKTPDKCLEYVSKKFDIPFNEERWSDERIKEDIKNSEHVPTRVPREKSEFRKKIDLAVKENGLLQYTYEQYVLFRDQVQLTENMV